MNDHDFMAAIVQSTLTGKKAIWVCPFCGEEMPSCEEPSRWAHCGEAGHAELYTPEES